MFFMLDEVLASVNTAALTDSESLSQASTTARRSEFPWGLFGGGILSGECPALCRTWASPPTNRVRNWSESLGFLRDHVLPSHVRNGPSNPISTFLKPKGILPQSREQGSCGAAGRVRLRPKERL